MYADDCLLYTIGNDWELTVPKIQAGLNSFQHWCLHNNMKLNVKKLKSLVIGSSYKLMNLDLNKRFVLNNIFLEYVHSYNYLGVILDTNMTLNPLLKKNGLKQDIFTRKNSKYYNIKMCISHI